MIRGDYSPPQPRRHERRQARVWPLPAKCPPWVRRVGMGALVAAVGLISVGLFNAPGIRARVLVCLAGGYSDQADAQSFLTKHYAATPKARDVVSACERLVRIKSDDAYAHVLLGKAYVGAGRTEEAISCYKEALALDPNCFDAYLGLGKAHFDGGRYQEAIAAYQRALNIQPDSAYGHLGLGLALSNAGKYEEAMRAFKKAKELDPDIAETQTLASDAYREQDRYAQAIEWFTNPSLVEDAYVQAHYNLGRAYLQVGDTALALEQQRVLQSLDPQLAQDLLTQIGK